MADDTIPAIAFENQLPYDVIVYDSFDYDDDDDSTSEQNKKPDSQAYFATLTQLGKVPAGTTVTLQPIHDSSAFVVESATDNKPIKRMVALSFDEITSLSIVKDDEAAMTQTFQFINFFLNHPDDPIAVAFNGVLKDQTVDLADNMDSFFQNQPLYNLCSFEDYMMGLAYSALHPATPDPSQPNGTSSLKTICALMGFKWPDSLNDIFVTKFTIAMVEKELVLTFEVDIATLPFETPQIASNVLTLLNGTRMVKAQLMVNFAIGLGIFGTRLSMLLDALTIPLSDSKTLNIKKPGITIDINPLFKFVVFTMKATFPFNINGKTFDALASFAIDNEEAAIGVEISGDKTSLPAPPGIKGLHFDEFGVGMAMFFKPPGLGVGIMGKFHIGEPASGNVISLDDDTFALVCEFVADAVKPKYAAFSIPELSLNQVIELFTDANPKIDIPVNFSDLSFHWSDGIMDAIVLPNGTLSAGGYGFSAAVNIFAFDFYGEANLDLNSGLTANVEVSPINWKNIFKLEGDGKGFSLKVDANGNPVPSNFVAKTQAEKDAVAAATDKQIVAPGGPCLVINTFTMPILHLNAKASLFELLDFAITADINKDGIRFELDYGAVLTQKMVCNLTNFHNFYGEFGYYIDKSIPLPTIDGVSLGSIPLKADVGAHLSINTTSSDVVISVGGQFDFESSHFSFGDFTADIHISKISHLLEAIGEYLVKEAKTIFSKFFDTAEQWADAAKKGIITGYEDAGKVVKTGYKKTKEELVAISKGVGFAEQEIASALKNYYGSTTDGVASLLKKAGYAAEDVGKAIRSAWDCTEQDVAWAMMIVGFTETEVAKGLRSAFGSTTDAVASAMKKVGYTAEQVGKAIRGAWDCLEKDVAWAMMIVGFTETDVAKGLRSAFDSTSDAVASAMKKIGYAAEQVGKAIRGAWDCLEKDVAWAMMMVGFSAKEVALGLRSAFDSTSDAVAGVLKELSYKAEDVALAIRGAWDCAKKDVGWAMMMVGFAAHEISNGLRSAFEATAQDVCDTFKSLEILAKDTANTLANDFQKTINESAAIMKQAGYAANDVASSLKNAFNTSVDAVASAMQQVGYAAGDVKNAFESLGGDFKSFADTVWDDAKHYLNPCNW